jgi:cobalt-precorrin-5B (C1)-methyltransferase
MPIDGENTESPSLRRGWTTGACATAAAKAAFQALLTGAFPDPVEIALPRGARVAFALAEGALDDQGAATAGVVKDAGDDPDVTHGALILVRVRRLPPGSGLQFRAGPGVGVVTRPGLALPPGEPAINPAPRRMIHEALTEVIGVGAPLDVEVEISIPGGERLAARTLNGRLGVVGGLSILGTTGVVIPYSCSAWIHSIHRGVDVARASGLTQVAGATGRTSEQAIAALHALPETALLEMGDFVGGMLKYLRTHPVPRVTVAGGLAKMTKLAQGRLDLHSARGAVDLEALAQMARDAGGSDSLAGAMAGANTALEAFQLAASQALPLGDLVAAKAWTVAASVLRGADIELEIALFDREGTLRGRAPFAAVHG